MILAGILLAGVALVALLVWRGRQQAAPSTRPERAKQQFASVEIRTGSSVCAAAEAVAGQRFLANSAPQLPLPDCSEARCRCTFVKLSDRRMDGRRWEDAGVSATLFTAAEQRGGEDRRQ
jgi:hypothetical protein